MERKREEWRGKERSMQSRAEQSKANLNKIMEYVYLFMYRVRVVVVVVVLK